MSCCADCGPFPCREECNPYASVRLEPLAPPAPCGVAAPGVASLTLSGRAIHRWHLQPGTVLMAFGLHAVAIGRATPMKIIHPTDFSECAEHARGFAVDLARALGAELILLHVAVEAAAYREGFMSVPEMERFFADQREWARQALEERAAEARGRGVPALAHVVTGAPAKEIVEAARRESADLIVMGTHGRSALERFFLGSVADKVIRTAHCAVVTRREAGEDRSSAKVTTPSAARKTGS